jgi:xylulokinase
VNATGVPVELYESDGSIGAALGAGIGAGFFKSPSEAFYHREVLQVVQPTQTAIYNEVYARWQKALEKQLSVE